MILLVEITRHPHRIPSGCAQFSQFWHLLKDPEAPYIIYFDSTSGTMQLGKWGNQITAANYKTKMLCFKFGSVVGVDLNGNFTTDNIKFNPTTNVKINNYGSAGDYGNSEANIVPGYTTADWDADRKDVSASTYHHKTNVLAGKGDPCKLVGLTIKQIQAGTVDNGRFRLPTLKENQDFVGSSTDQVAGTAYYSWTPGTPGVGTFPGGTANGAQLPTTGRRVGNEITAPDTGGFCWISTPHSNILGFRLLFSADGVSASAVRGFNEGYPVRCVPQS